LIAEDAARVALRIVPVSAVLSMKIGRLLGVWRVKPMWQDGAQHVNLWKYFQASCAESVSLGQSQAMRIAQAWFSSGRMGCAGVVTQPGVARVARKLKMESLIMVAVALAIPIAFALRARSSTNFQIYLGAAAVICVQHFGVKLVMKMQHSIADFAGLA